MDEKELESLFKECKYDPEAIGIKLLKQAGYKVETFRYSGRINIFDKKDNTKLLYNYDPSDYVNE
jgi:hypothetical protein